MADVAEKRCPIEHRSARTAAYTGAMANSGKVDRAQHKAAAQRNRVKEVTARARKAAKKRRRARAGKAAALKETTKMPAAS